MSRRLQERKWQRVKKARWAKIKPAKQSILGWWAAGVVLDFAAHPAPIVRVRPTMVGKMDSVLINVRKNKQKFAARIEAGPIVARKNEINLWW